MDSQEGLSCTQFRSIQSIRTALF